jgi:hypothetical protein
MYCEIQKSPIYVRKHILAQHSMQTRARLHAWIYGSSGLVGLASRADDAKLASNQFKHEIIIISIDECNVLEKTQGKLGRGSYRQQ